MNKGQLLQLLQFSPPKSRFFARDFSDLTASDSPVGQAESPWSLNHFGTAYGAAARPRSSIVIVCFCLLRCGVVVLLNTGVWGQNLLKPLRSWLQPTVKLMVQISSLKKQTDP